MGATVTIGRLGASCPMRLWLPRLRQVRRVMSGASQLPRLRHSSPDPTCQIRIHCIQTWIRYIVSHRIQRNPLVSRGHTRRTQLEGTHAGRSSQTVQRAQIPAKKQHTISSLNCTLGHGLAFGLGSWRAACTTPGTVGVGVHRHWRHGHFVLYLVLCFTLVYFVPLYLPLYLHCIQTWAGNIVSQCIHRRYALYLASRLAGTFDSIIPLHSWSY